MKVCIFDLDGTLINSLEDVTAALNHALESGGYEPTTAGHVFSLIGHGVGDVILALLPPQKRTAEEMLRIREVYYTYYEEHTAVYTEVYPHIYEMLENLKEKGYTLALLSNKTDLFTQKIARELFEGFFSYVRGAVDGFPLKPDPRVGELVCGELGVRAEDCVMIGDSHFDIQFAHACGFSSIGVDWGFAAEGELSEAGAHIIVSDPLQVSEIIGQS